MVLRCVLACEERFLRPGYHMNKPDTFTELRTANYHVDARDVRRPRRALCDGPDRRRTLWHCYTDGP